jgi:branched-subunit amino acid transport protein AzlD
VPRAAGLAVLLVALTGCTNDTFTRIGFPDPITKQGLVTLHLWQGSWIAGMAVACVVWGLILWSVIFHRRRRGDDRLPPQVRYNLPIEILYTALPFVLIAVLFYYTAKDEDYIDTLTSNPAVTVDVVGYQWSWQFNYPQYNVTDNGVMYPGPDLDRRDPLVLGAGVPVQAGRHPRPPQPLPGHADPHRHLHRALQRIVRPVPQPHAVHGEGREPAAVPAMGLRAPGLVVDHDGDHRLDRGEDGY